MSNRKYDLAVLIGRFQPFHNGHLQNLEKALQIADHVMIIFGSANQPRTIENPFTYKEREEMVRALNLAEEERIVTGKVEDYIYQNTRWKRAVQDEVQLGIQQIKKDWQDVDEIKDICILGYEKDRSSWYLKGFNWDFIDIGGYAADGGHPIDATRIREMFFKRDFDFMKGAIAPGVYDYLIKFSKTQDYDKLVRQFNFIKAYQKPYENLPYKPIFHTTDMVVIQSAHVLLVKRKSEPGEGLWALPGGFLGTDESILDSAVRELYEETKIKLPENVIRQNITFDRPFDHPKRSLRGRTITHAFLVELPGGPDGKLPKVKGSDDAADCRWIPLNEFENMGEQMFEDHYSIVKMMTSRAK